MYYTLIILYSVCVLIVLSESIKIGIVIIMLIDYDPVIFSSTAIGCRIAVLQWRMLHNILYFPPHIVYSRSYYNLQRNLK